MLVVAEYVREMTVKKSCMVNRDCLSMCSSCFYINCEGTDCILASVYSIKLL